jgi:outer membrane protein
MTKSLSLIIATLFVAGAANAAELKIGFVDVRKAIETTKAGQKVKKDLEADFKKREKELQKRADDVKKMNTDYEKKSLVLSDEAKLKKQGELQEEMMKYNQEVQKNTADLRKKEQELMEPIFKKMQDVINDLAKKESYALIIQNRENILYASQEVDLTDKVVKEFEKK